MVNTAYINQGPVKSAAGRTAAGRDAYAESGRTRAFEDADRHSRRVHFLRKAIPLAIIGTIVLVIMFRLFNPFRVKLPDVEISAATVSGSKLTMEMPKLSGFKKDNKAYEMTAEAASQDIKQPNIVELTAPVARIETKQGTWVRLSASTGIYDTSTEKLVVDDKVKVKGDNGLDMRLKDAHVDFKTGNMVTDKPVEADMNDGWVRSERMAVTENGKSLVFEGRVRSEFKSNALIAPPAAAAAETGEKTEQ